MEVCARCVEKMLLCEPGTGKSMSCQACKAAKVQCERPGEKEVEPKVVCWRKCTEVESPCDEKKKAWMEESLKGLEKSNGGLAVKKVGVSTLSAELKLLFRGLSTWLNHQNDLLEDLLEIKTQKVTLVLGMEVNEMEEMDEEEGMEVDKEEVRELLMEGPKEAEESEEGPGKVEESKQGAEVSGSVEVEKGLQSMESTESGGNRDDEMEV